MHGFDMQALQADSTTNRMLVQAAQRSMRRNLQSNMRTALEAMGLLEDSTAPLSNPPAASTQVHNASEGNNNTAVPTDPERGRSEQPTRDLNDQPIQAADRPSTSAPSTSRGGSRTAAAAAAADVAVFVASVGAAPESIEPQRRSRTARGSMTAPQPGAAPSPLP